MFFLLINRPAIRAALSFDLPQTRRREKSGRFRPGAAGITAPMQTLSSEGLTQLKLKANDVRQGIIRSLLAAGSGHSAGPLDMSDVFAALYGYLMRHDPARPDWEDRDRRCSRAEHIAPVRYSATAISLLSGRGAADAAQAGAPPRASERVRSSSGRRPAARRRPRPGVGWRSKPDGRQRLLRLVVTSDAGHQCGLRWKRYDRREVSSR